MKRTLLLKQTDLAIQVTALIIPAIFALCYHTMDMLMGAYFSVGAVQFVSCIVNGIALDSALKNKTRRACEIVVWTGCIWFLVFIAFSCSDVSMSYNSATSFIVAGLWIFLLGGTPLLSLWYYIISYNEVQQIKKLALQGH